jgi:hypothetical protein
MVLQLAEALMPIHPKVQLSMQVGLYREELLLLMQHRRRLSWTLVFHMRHSMSVLLRLRLPSLTQVPCYTPCSETRAGEPDEARDLQQWSERQSRKVQ